MYFDFMPGDLMGGDNIFDFEYSCVFARAVWNVRCHRYDTLFYGGPQDFDGDEKSIIWVNDFSQAVCINDVSLCVKLHFQIAAFFSDARCECVFVGSSL